MNDQPEARRKRVLLASHHANRRGSAISLVELGTRLPQYGYEPIFVFSKPGPLADDMSTSGFRVHLVRRQGLLRLRTIRQIQAIIRQHGISLVHINSAVPFSKYVALAARLSGIPVVWHIREPVEDKRMKRQRKWVRWLANRIVVLTRQQAEFFNLPERTERVFNGVSLSHFLPNISRNEAKIALGYRPDEFLFVQIGSIERNKGQLRSVQALTKVLRVQPRCRLLIVGGVVEPEEANAVTGMLEENLHVKDAVRLYGEARDVRPIIWAADCLLLPSLRESFPRTIMEAMASGVPVIASKVGAVPDMVDHGVTGLLVAPGDIDDLANAMREIANAGTVGSRETGKQASEAAKVRFDIDGHVAAIARIYFPLIEVSGSK